MDIDPTLYNTFERRPFMYLRKILCLMHLFGIYAKFLELFGKKFPGFAFGYSFMVVFARKPFS